MSSFCLEELIRGLFVLCGIIMYTVCFNRVNRERFHNLLLFSGFFHHSTRFHSFPLYNTWINIFFYFSSVNKAFLSTLTFTLCMRTTGGNLYAFDGSLTEAFQLALAAVLICRLQRYAPIRFAQNAGIGCFWVLLPDNWPGNGSSRSIQIKHIINIT